MRNILGVARYERRMLLRTTRFRVLAAIGLVIPGFFGIALSIAEYQGFESGGVFGLSAFIPFYFFTYIQTVVIAFVAGNFRAADERAGVAEVIAARPLSTAELVAGKYLGVLQTLSCLSGAVMLLTVGIQAAKLSLVGIPMDLTPYLAYFFLMTLPAMIYMSAVTFFLGTLLRNPTAVGLASIAYAFGVLMFLGVQYDRAGPGTNTDWGIVDFGAFFAPLFYSDMLGLGDISRLVELRGFYVALALALLGMAIVRYPRLPQPGMARWAGPALGIGGLAAAGALYAHMQAQDAAVIAYRESLLEAQVRHAAAPLPTAVHYDLDVAVLRDGVPLEATAAVRLRNDHLEPLDSLVFTLNPGLTVASVDDSTGRALEWRRDGSVLLIDPAAPLPPGGEITVSVAYAGSIDPDGFDLLRTEARLMKEDGPLRKGDLTTWIRPVSVYLPPRSRWYPATGVDYGSPDGRADDFATARITVDVPASLAAVTQGQRKSESLQDGRRRSEWESERPLPVLSLNAGVYEVFEARAGDVDLAVYVHPSHRSQAMFFEDATEEIVALAEQLLDAMERETGLPYPYERLSVVEIPFLVQWYYEGWEEHGGLTQPGILMVEEDVLLQQRFKRDFDRRSRRSRGDTDPGRMKRDLLASSVFRVFMSTEGRRSGLFRSPLAQLWSFDRGFTGAHSPLLERGFPAFMQQDVTTDVREAMFAQSGRGRGDRGDRDVIRSPFEMVGSTRRALADGETWDDMLARMQQESFAELDPNEDPALYRSIVDAKGVTLFRMIEAIAGGDAFVGALASFGESSRYRDVSFEDFERAVIDDEAGDSAMAPTDAALDGLVRDWLYGTSVPGYTVTRATARKLDDGRGAVVYQVIVRIRNGEPGEGFVEVQLSGFRDEVTQGVVIEGGREVEVAMTISTRPVRITVEPFFAKNRNPLVVPLRVPEDTVDGTPERYVRLVDATDSAFTEIIVDNEDDGFSMPVRRVQRYFRPGLRGDNWYVRGLVFAYGRYENNFRWKRPGDGAQPAVWTTPIPTSGEYDVAYYFIPSSRFGQRAGFWGLADSFEVTVFHARGAQSITLETSQLQGGWNLLGRFRFEAGQDARVELSDRADGRLYADAVRWRYIDPNNPEGVYDEDIAPWEVPSFNRRGGQGGPGGFRQR